MSPLDLLLQVIYLDIFSKVMTTQIDQEVHLRIIQVQNKLQTNLLVRKERRLEVNQAQQ